MAIGCDLDDTKTVTRLSAIGSRRSAGERLKPIRELFGMARILRSQFHGERTQ